MLKPTLFTLWLSFAFGSSALSASPRVRLSRARHFELLSRLIIMDPVPLLDFCLWKPPPPPSWSSFVLVLRDRVDILTDPSNVTLRHIVE
ncbi:uncharacterized protein LY79DRAFT_534933 [Colletotrichum navitas]|uniref:Secreted protein n=1 Tax=Colletotrichum navitas TaxID=681940 RepID=A0AAD8QB96_9PEZI|nr:uncharacterized protein LY79DRAFT_534933 [Colletotrichum navitas]KAK1599392.1 hypothetical protein LY79DRAFT_534933 [Colletotrichum navitas]